jgi:hypothetical protein
MESLDKLYPLFKGGSHIPRGDNKNFYPVRVALMASTTKIFKPHEEVGEDFREFMAETLKGLEWRTGTTKRRPDDRDVVVKVCSGPLSGFSPQESSNIYNCALAELLKVEHNNNQEISCRIRHDTYEEDDLKAEKNNSIIHRIVKVPFHLKSLKRLPSKSYKILLFMVIKQSKQNLLNHNPV